MTYILADIGATKIRMAAAETADAFSEPIIFETPQEYDRALELIAKTAESLGGGDMRGFIAGVPGARNLPEWKGKPFKDDIAKLVQVPVTVENDTALVGLGEAVYGAGKGASLVAYITVSTGVNGVRVVHGAVDVSRQGFEIGGQYLATAGTTTLEDLVSGRSIHKRFGMHPRELGKEHPVWEELAQILAYGVHNTILHWSPDRVVLGGSMMNDIGISVDRVQEHVRAIMQKFPATPEIVHSQLADKGGLWGAVVLLKEQVARSSQLPS